MECDKRCNVGKYIALGSVLAIGLGIGIYFLIKNQEKEEI